MIVGNLIGFVMFFLASAAGALVTKLVGHVSNNTIALLAAPVMILLDVAYRKHRQATWFGRAGGRLFFIPVWLFGIVLGVACLVSIVRP